MANKAGRADPAKARERKFIAHYSVHFNGAAAVRFAGYSTPHASQYAYELLAKPRIQEKVKAAIADLGELHFQLNNELIGDLKVMKDALADPTRLLDASGNVLDPKDWPEDLRGAIRGFEIEEQTIGKEDPIRVRVKKLRFESRAAVIASLAKISGHIVERTQFIGKDGVPIDPVSAPAPIIHITVGAIAVDPAAEPSQARSKKKK